MARHVDPLHWAEHAGGQHGKSSVGRSDIAQQRYLINCLAGHKNARSWRGVRANRQYQEIDHNPRKQSTGLVLECWKIKPRGQRTHGLDELAWMLTRPSVSLWCMA